MPLTTEQRRENLVKARATRTANLAAQKAAPVAGPTLIEHRQIHYREPQVEEQVEAAEEDDVLSQLMATLSAARSKKVKQSELLKQLAGLLDQIDPTKNPELADDPTIQAFVEKINENRVKQADKLGLPPGTQIGTGLAQDAVPWRYSDLNKYCRKPLPGHEKDPVMTMDNTEPDLITFIPNRTEQVIWNGLMCQFIADEQITTYRCFYDVMMESKRLVRIGAAHKAFMFGDSDVLPAELQKGDASFSTMRARAFMSIGPKKGGGSIIIGYGGDEKFGQREEPTGEAPSGEAPA